MYSTVAKYFTYSCRPICTISRGNFSRKLFPPLSCGVGGAEKDWEDIRKMPEHGSLVRDFSRMRHKYEATV